VRGQCVISEVVLAEIRDAPAHEASQILRQLDRVKPSVYAITADMDVLARAYIAAGALPEAREQDARHVAAATCLQLDFLASWNHRHMTRPMKRLQYESANRLKQMTPAKRREFWAGIRREARARGLTVVEADKAAKRPPKRIRRTG